MSITPINIGNNANDGLGDNLRTAFEKVNANFTELSAVANAITSVSITAPANPSGYSIFTGLENSALKFKDLAAGRNISFNETPNSVIISNSASMFTKVATATSEINSALTSTLKFAGDADISITLTQPIPSTDIPPGETIPGVVNVRSNTPIGLLIKSYDFGNIDNAVHNVFQLFLSATVIDFGANCEVVYANANLIAAGPELLETLERCIAVMESRCPEASPLPDARAAIAKATGG